jgi:hypothetical protein
MSTNSKQNTRAVPRRKLLQALTLAGPLSTTVEGQEPAISIDVLRNVSTVHGSNLSDQRLRIIQPALERRLNHVQAIRQFDMDELVEPAPMFVPRR